MGTVIEDFYRSDCSGIDPSCVKAYVKPEIYPTGTTNLAIDSSWGKESVDLAPVVKAAETTTHMFLTPTQNPVYLQYDNEDGAHECIHGDNLSRIISMTKLKDVTQSTPIANGNVYIYDSNLGAFKPFDLTAFINSTNAAISNLGNTIASMQNSIANLQTAVTNLGNRLTAVEQKLVRPSGIPTDTVLAWGNRNIYNDNTNTGSKMHGIFTHDTSNNIADDTYYA